MGLQVYAIYLDSMSYIFKNIISFIKEINDLFPMFTAGNQVGIFHYHHINEPPLKQDNDLTTWKIREVMELFEDRKITILG